MVRKLLQAGRVHTSGSYRARHVLGALRSVLAILEYTCIATIYDVDDQLSMSISAWHRASVKCDECGQSFYSNDERDHHQEEEHLQSERR
jgi:hypothetical protein